MARYLIRQGVNPEDILVEGYSDDTLGNSPTTTCLANSEPNMAEFLLTM